MTKIIEFCIYNCEVCPEETGASDLNCAQHLYRIMEERGCLFDGPSWRGTFLGELTYEYIPDGMYTWYKQVIKES